jgi:mRNA interferase MazF
MGVVMAVNQYEIYWTKLDPTVGSEIQKTRPCVVFSPNEMNSSIDTLIIAPRTTKSHNFPTRLRTTVEGKDCWIVIDQIRAIDKSRLKEKLGELDREDISKLKNIINKMLVE